MPNKPLQGMRLAALLLPALLCMALPAQAQNTRPQIGRLFSSPDERESLDQLRKDEEVRPAKADDPERIQARKQLSVELTLDGYVKHKGGKATTWINQRDQYDHEMPQGVIVLGREAQLPSVPLLLESGKRIQLKPGQTYDVVKDRVREAWEAPPARPQAQQQEAGKP